MRRPVRGGYHRLLQALKKGDERVPRKQMDMTDLEQLRKSRLFVPFRISLEELLRRELEEEPLTTPPTESFPETELEIADTLQALQRLFPPSPLQQRILKAFLEGDSLPTIAKELKLPYKTVVNEFNLLTMTWQVVAFRKGIEPPIPCRKGKLALEVKKAEVKAGFVLQGRLVAETPPKAGAILQFDGTKWVAVMPNQLFSPTRAIANLPVVGKAKDGEARAKINEILDVLRHYGLLKEGTE